MSLQYHNYGGREGECERGGRQGMGEGEVERGEEEKGEEKEKRPHTQAQWGCVKDQPREPQIAQARTTLTAKYSSTS